MNRHIQTTSRALTWVIPVGLLSLVPLLTGCLNRPGRAEIALLDENLHVERGRAIADVGAGSGDVTMVLARKVAPGAVFASEVEPEKRRALTERAHREHLANVTVVEASAIATGLAESCCDAVLMRSVFHHLPDPQPVLAGVVAALKPGGRLAIVDFAPSWLLAPWHSGGDHSGHGVTRATVIREVTRAGLEHVASVDRYPGLWPLRPYLVVFRKPERAANGAASEEVTQ